MSDFGGARNKIIGGLYKSVLKPIFFSFDPELVHDRIIKTGVFLGQNGFTKKIVNNLFHYEDPILEQEICGIKFKNPIGLSAGFDKNAELTDILPEVGFGFAEVGSITGEPCLGNPRPRLWRLKNSKSLLVYYGLKNDGSEAIHSKLVGKNFSIPVGISVAMTNCKDNLNIKNAVFDFAKAFKVMSDVASYITVNISCPNTLGGQPFLKSHNLDYLLDILDTLPYSGPVFVKISPDLSKPELDLFLETILSHRVDGVICSNLTKKRENHKIKDKKIPEVGGMSGKVVEDLSNDIIAYVYKKVGHKLTIVGSGGVFTAEDAYRKIKLGASLVQLITGMVYEGPQVVSSINQGLSKLLKEDGFTHIKEAVGFNNN